MSAGLQVTELSLNVQHLGHHIMCLLLSDSKNGRYVRKHSLFLKRVSVNTGEGQADGNVNHVSCHCEDSKHKEILKITGSSVTQMLGVL